MNPSGNNTTPKRKQKTIDTELRIIQKNAPGIGVNERIRKLLARPDTIAKGLGDTDANINDLLTPPEEETKDLEELRTQIENQSPHIIERIENYKKGLKQETTPEESVPDVFESSLQALIAKNPRVEEYHKILGDDYRYLGAAEEIYDLLINEEFRNMPLEKGQWGCRPVVLFHSIRRLSEGAPREQVIKELRGMYAQGKKQVYKPLIAGEIELFKGLKVKDLDLLKELSQYFGLPDGRDSSVLYEYNENPVRLTWALNIQNQLIKKYFVVDGILSYHLSMFPPHTNISKERAEMRTAASYMQKALIPLYTSDKRLERYGEIFSFVHMCDYKPPSSADIYRIEGRYNNIIRGIEAPELICKASEADERLNEDYQTLAMVLTALYAKPRGLGDNRDVEEICSVWNDFKARLEDAYESVGMEDFLKAEEPTKEHIENLMEKRQVLQDKIVPVLKETVARLDAIERRAQTMGQTIFSPKYYLDKGEYLEAVRLIEKDALRVFDPLDIDLMNDALSSIESAARIIERFGTYAEYSQSHLLIQWISALIAQKYSELNSDRCDLYSLYARKDIDSLIEKTTDEKEKEYLNSLYEALSKHRFEDALNLFRSRIPEEWRQKTERKKEAPLEIVSAPVAGRQTYASSEDLKQVFGVTELSGELAVLAEVIDNVGLDLLRKYMKSESGDLELLKAAYADAMNIVKRYNELHTLKVRTSRTPSEQDYAARIIGRMVMGLGSSYMGMSLTQAYKDYLDNEPVRQRNQERRERHLSDKLKKHRMRLGDAATKYGKETSLELRIAEQEQSVGGIERTLGFYQQELERMKGLENPERGAEMKGLLDSTKAYSRTLEKIAHKIEGLNRETLSPEQRLRVTSLKTTFITLGNSLENVRGDIKKTVQDDARLIRSEERAEKESLTEGLERFVKDIGLSLYYFEEKLKWINTFNGPGRELEVEILVDTINKFNPDFKARLGEINKLSGERLGLKQTQRLAEAKTSIQELEKRTEEVRKGILSQKTDSDGRAYPAGFIGAEGVRKEIEGMDYVSAADIIKGDAAHGFKDWVDTLINIRKQVPEEKWNGFIEYVKGQAELIGLVSNLEKTVSAVDLPSGEQRVLVDKGFHGEVFLAEDKKGRKYILKTPVARTFNGDLRKHLSLAIKNPRLELVKLVQRLSPLGMKLLSDDKSRTLGDEYRMHLKIAEVMPGNVPKLWEYLDKQDAIAMEYLEGETLSDAIQKGRRDLDLGKLGELIAALHNHGFVHLDLSDRNIILSPEGVWKLIDFRKTRATQGNNNETAYLMRYDIWKACLFLPNELGSKFVESYLLNRDLDSVLESFREKKIGVSDLEEWLAFLGHLRKNLVNPSQKTLDYVSQKIHELEIIVGPYGSLLGDAEIELGGVQDSSNQARETRFDVDSIKACCSDILADKQVHLSQSGLIWRLIESNVPEISVRKHGVKGSLLLLRKKAGNQIRKRISRQMLVLLREDEKYGGELVQAIQNARNLAPGLTEKDIFFRGLHYYVLAGHMSIDNVSRGELLRFILSPQYTREGRYSSMDDYIINRCLEKREEIKCVVDLGCAANDPIRPAVNSINLSEKMLALDVNANLIGVDIATDEIRRKKKTLPGNLEFITSTATDMPFKSSTVDLIKASSSLHTIADQDRPRAIQEVKRILKENGLLVTNYGLEASENTTEINVYQKTGDALIKIESLPMTTDIREVFETTRQTINDWVSGLRGAGQIENQLKMPEAVEQRDSGWKFPSGVIGATGVYDAVMRGDFDYAVKNVLKDRDYTDFYGWLNLLGNVENRLAEEKSLDKWDGFVDAANKRGGFVEVLALGDYSSEDCLNVVNVLCNLREWAKVNAEHPLSELTRRLSLASTREPFTQIIFFKEGDTEKVLVKVSNKDKSYLKDTLPLKAYLSSDGVALFVLYGKQSWKVTSDAGGMHVEETSVLPLPKTMKHDSQPTPEPALLQDVVRWITEGKLDAAVEAIRASRKDMLPADLALKEFLDSLGVELNDQVLFDEFKALLISEGIMGPSSEADQLKETRESKLSMIKKWELTRDTRKMQTLKELLLSEDDPAVIDECRRVLGILENAKQELLGTIERMRLSGDPKQVNALRMIMELENNPEVLTSIQEAIDELLSGAKAQGPVIRNAIIKTSGRNVAAISGKITQASIFDKVQGLMDDIADGRIAPGLGALKALEQEGLLPVESTSRYSNRLDRLIIDQIREISLKGDTEAIPYLEKMSEAKPGDRFFPGSFAQEQIKHALPKLKDKKTKWIKITQTTASGTVLADNFVPASRQSAAKTDTPISGQAGLGTFSVEPFKISLDLQHLLRGWRGKPLSEESSELYDWIGQVLEQRKELIDGAEKQFGTMSTVNYNLALRKLVELVSKNPLELKDMRDNLVAAYPFLAAEPDKRGAAILGFYRGPFLKEAIESLRIDDPELVGYLNNTLIEFIEGNPSILFNPGKNRALVATSYAEMSAGMEKALKDKCGELTSEMKEVMCMVMYIEVVRHELEHVLTGAIQAHMGAEEVTESALNLVWEGLTMLQTAGGLSKLIGAELARVLPFLQNEEKGFRYDSIDHRYWGERRTCMLEVGGKTLEKNILLTVAYGLRKSIYDYEDFLPCRDESELLLVDSKLKVALDALEGCIEHSRTSSEETENLVNEVKKHLSRIMSTYKMNKKGSAMGENALAALQRFISALDEGSFEQLDREGFFKNFLEEHEWHVPG